MFNLLSSRKDRIILEKRIILENAKRNQELDTLAYCAGFNEVLELRDLYIYAEFDEVEKMKRAAENNDLLIALYSIFLEKKSWPYSDCVLYSGERGFAFWFYQYGEFRCIASRHVNKERFYNSLARELYIVDGHQLKGNPLNRDLVRRIKEFLSTGRSKPLPHICTKKCLVGWLYGLAKSSHASLENS